QRLLVRRAQFVFTRTQRSFGELHGYGQRAPVADDLERRRRARFSAGNDLDQVVVRGDGASVDGDDDVVEPQAGARAGRTRHVRKEGLDQWARRPTQGERPTQIRI